MDPSPSLRNHALLAPVRSLYRPARNLLEKALHPVRRLRAKRLIEALHPIRRVAVLCTGNICRSPYAAARLSQLWGDNGPLEVRSAGLMGSKRLSPEEAVRIARERGLEMGSHRSELFSLTLANWADLVIVMSPGQRADVARDFSVSKNRILILADLDPNPPFRRTIPDPLDLPTQAFADCFDQIDRSLHQLIGLMRGSR